MNAYELTYIVSPEITGEEAEAKSKEIESAIQSREGIIVRQSNPIAKTLSYPIAKRASGFLGVLEFQLEPEKLIELKEIIAKDGKIVRHIILTKKPVKIKKQRRDRKEAAPVFETFDKKEETKGILEPAQEKTQESKAKVELKDIEQQLDEILGE